jgi:hypothetical protein
MRANARHQSREFPSREVASVSRKRADQDEESNKVTNANHSKGYFVIRDGGIGPFGQRNSDLAGKIFRYLFHGS